jgi:hypothetical protein
MTVGAEGGRFFAVKVMDVALRFPAHSALYRIELPEPPAGADGEATEPPITVRRIYNASDTVRFVANGDYFVLEFDAKPIPGTVETLNVEYSDGSSEQVSVTYS